LVAWLGLVWDGVARIERFLITYFGTADTPYMRAIAMYLWTAMAGRVLQPGVKADMVPVAVGPQGSRKSSAVAAMSPSIDFVGNADLSTPPDDLARRMRGKLLIELDELKGLSAREAEHIKSFITRTHEEWTPKFVELCTRYARRCVFIGTSNKDDFLADETGNRRWLPFRSGLCDPDGIALARDQLWAEARDLFKLKGVLHRDAENLARVEHSEFAEHDQWETAVKAWLYTPDFDGMLPGNRPYLTSRDVLKEAIGLPDSQQGRVHQVRIKRVMLRNHYTEGSLRIHGTKTRVYLPESLF
jgi:predicted P-loop ATPase